MEGEGSKVIYSFRRSFIGESDNVIENLCLEGMSGSPTTLKLVTGKCRCPFRVDKCPRSIDKRTGLKLQKCVAKFRNLLESRSNIQKI